MASEELEGRRGNGVESGQFGFRLFGEPLDGLLNAGAEQPAVAVQVTSIGESNPISDWLTGLHEEMLQGARPTTVSSPFGTHGVVYRDDGEGEYASVGFCLPDNAYAEIDDGTYGQLQAFRLYLDESGDYD